MNTQSNVITVKAATSGNVAAQVFTHFDGKALKGQSVIEAGGRIVLGAGVTSVGVLVVDATGKVLHNATITVSTDVPPVPQGAMLPFYVTTTSIAGGTIVTTYWQVRQ